MSGEALGATERPVDAPKPRLVVHEVIFEKNRLSREWRARCTCGWFTIGQQADVQKDAAVHDQWVPA